MKKIVFLLFFGIQISFVSAQEFVFSKQADLNSDNIIDKISLTEIDGVFTLEINNFKTEITFDDEDIDGFKIVDINKNDVFREIAVYASGPGGGSAFKLYYFDGKTIHFMNSLKDFPTFNGNGIVYVDNWEGFWKRRRKFVLNKQTHKLSEIEQFAFYVGVNNITVKNYVSIYSDAELTKKTATLSKNSKIEILICKKDKNNYNNDLYLIKSKSGLIGWIKYSELEKNCSGFNFAG